MAYLRARLRARVQTPSLEGDVYELTVSDVKTFVAPEEVPGKVLLHDVYWAKTPAVITIPISDELKNQFIIYRPRIM